MKKIVLITGASSGIGKETAILLHDAGYTVYGAARNIRKMEDLKEKGIRIIPMDITDEKSVISGIETIKAKEKQIDILINNAGYGSLGTVEDVTLNEARYQMEVNVFGAARLIRLILPMMRKQGSGKILNISSIGGKVAAPGGGWYYASKHALEGLSDSLRMEVKPFGIDVILIEPGVIQTNWENIALQNMDKTSGNTVYKNIIKANKDFFSPEKPLTPPIVIARLIKEAIEKRNPKPRYSKGYMSGISLFGKRWLNDRLFDKIMSKIMKL